MRWTRQQLAEYCAKRAKANPDGIRPLIEKPTQGHALECVASGKEKGSTGPVVSTEPCRRRIKFVIYSVRPCDWDGYHIKEVQDLLIHAGILDDDKWNLLSGEVVSEKVYKKEEERTEIVIEEPL